MSIWLQNLLVLTAVCLAGAYLARSTWQTVTRRKASSCESCGSCGTRTPAGPNVVEILPLAPPTSQPVRHKA